jgi:hypothetical protein
MKFKHGDKVKIIQRKSGNTTGCHHYNQPNGDVGIICYISNNVLSENEDGSGNYYGLYDNLNKYAFQDNDLELVSTDFVLPEKWCIKTERNDIGRLIGKWFGDQSSNGCYVNSCLGEYYHSHNLEYQSILNKGYLSASYANYEPKPGYTEITFDQFKQYVLKDTMQTNQFKKGDYIVTLKNNLRSNFIGTSCAKENYCFKQRINSYYISPVLDLAGSRENGNSNLQFDKSDDMLKDWRYATPEEIAEYDRLGKPYDVTTLAKEGIPVDKSLVGRYLKALKNSARGVPVDAGNYVLITEPGYVKVENRETTWCCSFIEEDEFELMPERFVPPTETKATESPKTEDLIEEAKRRYPVGCKAKCFVTNNFYEITKDVVFEAISNGTVYSYIKGEVYHNHRSDGNWAEVELPEPISKKWEPKVGDWVMVHENELPITSTWMGEGGRVNHQGPFLIEKIEGYCVHRMSGIRVSLSFSRFRKAEPHEIPKTEEPKILAQVYLQATDPTENLLITKPMNEYTAEEALAELKRRGFKKGVEYTFMCIDGRYLEQETRKARYDPSIADGGSYIDCGSGYLWYKEYPSNLHRGPITKVDGGPAKLAVFDELPFIPEHQLKTINHAFQPRINQDYSKPETLLTKTTLNY